MNLTIQKDHLECDQYNAFLMSITAIIIQFLNGDRKAAKDLYLQTYQWLFAIAIRYVYDDASAKDILQNTYEKIYQNLNTIALKPESTAKVWMKKICINEALMLIRKKKNWDKLQFNTHQEAFLPQYEFENQMLHKLLSSLPQQQRLSFNLYAIEGYSHKEISKLLDIKESYSRTLVARARKQLAAQLSKEKINEAL